MTPERIQYLSDRFFAQRCTPAEKAELAQWITEHPDDAGLKALLAESWERYEPDTTTRLQASVPLQRVERRLFPAPGLKWWYWAAAAVVGMLVTMVALLESDVQQAIPEKNNTALAPARNKAGAILTLSNGTTVELDSAGNGVVAKDQNTTVVLQQGGLSYQPVNGNSPGAAPLFNTLQTPRGRTFRLLLPDGTRVWLNAASSIHYPTAFTGAERKIIVTGEAYFEVAADVSKPFRVQTKDQEVTVLGTRFNINAYQDENSTQTTLLQGSVKVAPSAYPAAAVILTPGQQSLLGKGHTRLTVDQEADTKEVLAWKEGIFLFREADIQTIMRQVARWYDVDIRYEGNLDDVQLSGALSRKKEAGELLQLLQMTKRVRFSTSGNTITVLPY